MRIVNRVVPWILLIAGVALAVTAAVSGVRGFVAALQPVATWTTPASERVTLPAGTWVVFQRVPGAGAGLIDADAITVVGPQGRVATACVYCGASETLTLNGVRYEGIVRFGADRAGAYTITTETRGVVLAVAPPALQTVGSTFASLAWIGLGVMMAVAGAIWLLVLLILHLTRDSRSGPAPAATPASWPPPGGPPVA